MPVKSVEFSQTKAAAAADLTKALGTLRYLRGLKAARRAQQGGAGGSGEGGEGGEAAPSPSAAPAAEAAAPAPAAPPPGVDFAALHRERQMRRGQAQGEGTAGPSQPPPPLHVVCPEDPPPSRAHPELLPAGQCMICQESLGEEFVLLPCGHANCCGCVLLRYCTVPRA